MSLLLRLARGSAGGAKRAPKAFRVLFLGVSLALMGQCANAAPTEPCTDDVALSLMQSGQWAPLRTLTQQRLDRTPVGADPALRICLRTQLGGALMRLGEFSQAEALLWPAYEDALKLLGPDHEQMQSAALFLATNYGKQGHYDKAIPVFRAMLPGTEKRHGASSLPVHTLLRNTSTALHWVGNYADALPLDVRSLAIAEQLQPGPGSCPTTALCDAIRGKAAKSMAGTLIRLRRPAEAMPLAQRGVDLLRTSLGALSADTLDAQLIMASALIDVGRLLEGRALQLKVRDLSLQTLGPTHELTLKAQGEATASITQAGELQASLATQAERLAQLRARLGSAHPDVLLASANLVYSLMQVSQVDQALVVAEASMRDMLSRKDTLMFDDRSLDAWRAMQSRLGQHYIELLLLKKRTGDAFLVSEVLKLRRPGLSLNGEGASVLASDAPSAAAKAASRRLALIDQKVALARSLEADATTWMAQRSEAFAEWRRLQEQTPAATLPSATAMPAWALTALKQPGPVVAFRFFGPTLVAFMPEVAGLRVIVMDKQDRVRPSIEAYRLAMRAAATPSRLKASSGLPLWRLANGAYEYGDTQPKPDAQRLDDLDEVLRSLSQWLIEPLTPHLAGRDRLLISVDQNLGHVPFESLPMPADPSAKGLSALFAPPRFLGDQMAVSLLPSLALLDTLQERKHRYASLDRRPLLAVGGAHYARVVPNGLINFVRFDADRKLGAMDMKQIWQSVQHDRSLLPLALMQWEAGAFNDLPGSLAEVDAIASIANAIGPKRSLVLRGAEASEASVQQLAESGKLADFRLLHFSAHGFLSDDEPALSAIVLKQVNREPGTDGYLTAAEISTLELRSDLVVVSACDSGANASPGGHGAAGLSMALFQAGTVSSILSLWPIEDDDSRRFMEQFHADVSAGVDVAESLRRTRAWARKQKLSRNVVQGLVRWGL